MLQVNDKQLGDMAKQISGEANQNSPKECPKNIQNQEAHRRDTICAEQERRYGTQTIEESKSQDEQQLVSIHEIKHPFRPVPPIGALLQNFRTLDTTKIEVKLIARQGSQESIKQNPGKFKIALVGSETCQNKDGFSFEESAYCYGSISIGRYQCFKRHRLKTFARRLKYLV